MSNEAVITINGKELSDEEAHIVRMAVDAFRAITAQGIEEGEEGVIGAMTAHYVEALASVQKLLATSPEHRIQ